MQTIDQSKPILVTGGTGYMASWIIKQLLDDGKEVRTTVRDLSQKDKSPLKAKEHWSSLKQICSKKEVLLKPWLAANWLSTRHRRSRFQD